MNKLKPYALAQNDEILDLEILATGIEELPLLMVLMELEGKFDILCYEEGMEWIDEPDPQDN